MQASHSDGPGVEFVEPRFVEVDGRQLAYEEVAPADPQGTVLLLCGIGATAATSLPGTPGPP